MSLTIAHLATRAQLPRPLAALAPRIEAATRHELPRQLARQLSGEAMGISRLRQLRVRVELSRRDLEAGRLPELWAGAVRRALWQVLRGSGDSVVRVEDRPAWIERVIVDLLAGTAAGQWEYDEFRAELARPAGEAALLLLLRDPAISIEVLRRLEASGKLEDLLQIWDELALERLFRALSSLSLTRATQPLNASHLLAIARLILADSAAPSHRLAGRRYALHLFARLSRTSASVQLMTPRQVLHALTALESLMQLSGAWSEGLLPFTGLQDSLPQQIRVLFEELARSATDPVSGRVQPAGIQALGEAVTALRQHRPNAVQQQPSVEEHWIDSEIAGLFLLVDTLEEFGWPRCLAVLGKARGERFVPYVFTLLGLALVGRFSTEPERIDAGLTLWAGLGESPDLRSLRDFFDRSGEAERRELLRILDLENAATSVSWQALFDLLARRLSRQFTARIKGFRHASHDFARQNFLALPGRIRVDEKSLQVVLAPSPLTIALHIAGMDRPRTAPSWLKGRQLNIELEGL